MSGLIEQKFSELKKLNRAALVCYLTAGEPSLEITEEVAVRIVENGADIIEIGVPFSDPMADGPVIQRACERALKSGATLEKILETVRRIKNRVSVPILIFGYCNPFYRYGVGRFASEAAAAGADGVLAVDLPPEEAYKFQSVLQKNGLEQIFLLSPNTTDKRIEAVARLAGGFIYLVSVTGVTGAHTDKDYFEDGKISALVEKIRLKTGLPVGVGFGISTPEQAAKVASFSDAVIVGSAIMRIVEKSSENGSAPYEVGKFVSALSKACVRSAGP